MFLKLMNTCIVLHRHISCLVDSHANSSTTDMKLPMQEIFLRSLRVMSFWRNMEIITMQ
jgi:hypothetical protein